MSPGSAPWPSRVSVLGAGGFASDLAGALQADGVAVERFLTSGTPRAAALDGLPVQQADAGLLAAAPVAVGIFNREPASDYAHLRSWALALQPSCQLLWPQALYGRLASRLGFRYWMHPTDAYDDASEAQARARMLFDDPASQALFDHLIAFRRTAFASPPPPQPGPQYLPEWLADLLRKRCHAGLQFVDAGAFRGETLLELSRHLPMRLAWAIEPDPQNHAALEQALAEWSGEARTVAAALSDRHASLPFSAGAGEASRIDVDGTSPEGAHVPVRPLDDIVCGERVDFVKFDVEGHEEAALRGAAGTLARCRPVLAIAAYHRWDDLWRLPLHLAATGLGYRLRLGLHAHNSFDTVLYAY